MGATGGAPIYIPPNSGFEDTESYFTGAYGVTVLIPWNIEGIAFATGCG